MPAVAPEKSIFLHAIGLAAAEDRRAYLDAVCRDDPRLRADIDALLAAHDRLGGGPAPGPAETGTIAAAATVSGAVPGAGTVVAGRYTLVELIGEGGMGSVWRAEQAAPVRRQVALKVIKPGMDSAAVLTRFEAERQALALMDHPNIAKVLDAGTADTGRPYFVMELVKGVPLTRFCDEHRLTPGQRLELFVPVCRAVQHAHQKGVIHRDLKPGNILVALYDSKPVPKVIDFGVAKAMGPQLTAHTLVTGFGAVVGTPEYMSPEQAELNQLDIDTRSDIYALGVLLYELLAGSPPFTRQELERAGVLEMLRVIREREPPKPSTRLSASEGLPTLAANRGTEPARLTRLVRGELDWIVMKALEKDRDRRYGTANSFAADVQRYLADEPVQACPPSAWYRFQKFARRNKGPVIAVSVSLLCLVAGIIGTSAGLVWAVRERDEKARALVAESQARAKAIAALRDMTDEIVENQMARNVNLSDENKEFLRKIIAHYEGFAAFTADDAENRVVRAEGNLRAGRMRHRLGELRDAEAAYRTALALYGRLHTSHQRRKC
jgi:serine/threonine protein kinase